MLVKWSHIAKTFVLARGSLFLPLEFKLFSLTVVTNSILRTPKLRLFTDLELKHQSTRTLSDRYYKVPASGNLLNNRTFNSSLLCERKAISTTSKQIDGTSMRDH